MDQYIKEISIITLNKEKGKWYIPMEIFMKVNGKITLPKGMEYIKHQVALSIKEIG